MAAWVSLKLLSARRWFTCALTCKACSRRKGPWHAPWLERVLPTVVRLVARAPERTVFTRFLPPPSPEDASGMWRRYYEKWPAVTRNQVDPELVELVPALRKFAPPAAVFDKTVYSAFFDGRLHRLFRESKVTTLLISGSETDVCVLSTVLGAIDYGYRIVVVKDALCSSSDDAHDASMALYAQRYNAQVELASADEVLEMWPRNG
jgi:nicotinamidase-related amidase